jgi:hypothetical protein
MTKRCLLAFCLLLFAVPAHASYQIAGVITEVLNENVPIGSPFVASISEAFDGSRYDATFTASFASTSCSVIFFSDTDPNAFLLSGGAITIDPLGGITTGGFCMNFFTTDYASFSLTGFSVSGQVRVINPPAQICLLA